MHYSKLKCEDKIISTLWTLPPALAMFLFDTWLTLIQSNANASLTKFAHISINILLNLCRDSKRSWIISSGPICIIKQTWTWTAVLWVSLATLTSSYQYCSLCRYSTDRINLPNNRNKHGKAKCATAPLISLSISGGAAAAEAQTETKQWYSGGRGRIHHVLQGVVYKPSAASQQFCN